MNATHLHLILNHIPVLGTIFGMGLLMLALGKKNTELAKAALLVFLLTALMALPVYYSGDPAQDWTKGLPGFSEQVVEQHEEAAEIAFASVLLLGAAGLASLIWVHRAKALPRWLGLMLLAGSLIVSSLMARTAYKGGQIRHTEIRSATTAAPENQDKTESVLEKSPT